MKNLIKKLAFVIFISIGLLSCSEEQSTLTVNEQVVESIVNNKSDWVVESILDGGLLGITKKNFFGLKDQSTRIMISIKGQLVYFSSLSDYDQFDFTQKQQNQILEIFENEIQDEIKRIKKIKSQKKI